MRDLFRALTDKDMHFPEHLVINKMTYKNNYIETIITQKILFLRAGKMAVQLQNKTGTLTEYMIALRGEFAVKQSSGSACINEDDNSSIIVFTKEDILEFVNDVHDQNPIHRNDPYIVPRCLLLEALLQKYSVISIKFLRPVLAEDVVHIKKYGNTVTCTVLNDTVCEGTCIDNHLIDSKY